MNKIVAILTSTLLTGCGLSLHLLEARVKASGSTVPRNPQEQLIFDYYQALKEQRYDDVYKLRGWDGAADEHFVQEHTEDYESLATMIAIGEEMTFRGDKDAVKENRVGL